MRKPISRYIRSCVKSDLFVVGSYLLKNGNYFHYLFYTKIRGGEIIGDYRVVPNVITRILISKRGHEPKNVASINW